MIRLPLLVLSLVLVLLSFQKVVPATADAPPSGSSPTAVSLTNSYDVTITLHTVQEGAKLTLAVSGSDIELKK